MLILDLNFSVLIIFFIEFFSILQFLLMASPCVVEEEQEAPSKDRKYYPNHGTLAIICVLLAGIFSMFILGKQTEILMQLWLPQLLKKSIVILR